MDIESLKGREKSNYIGRQNMRPIKSTRETQTEEERLIRSKGGKARQAQIAERKSMREDLNQLLNVRLSKSKAKELIGDDIAALGDNITMQRVLLVKASQEALNGNMRALELLRDTVGDFPKKQLEIQADVMTDADRALIDKLSGRIC